MRQRPIQTDRGQLHTYLKVAVGANLSSKNIILASIRLFVTAVSVQFANLTRNNAILADIHAQKGARNLSDPTDVLTAAVVVATRGATNTFVNARNSRKCARIVKAIESIAAAYAASRATITFSVAGIANTAARAREATAAVEAVRGATTTFSNAVLTSRVGVAHARESTAAAEALRASALSVNTEWRSCASTARAPKAAAAA
jgi:hypothetical protein